MRFFTLVILALLATLVKGFWIGSSSPQKEEDPIQKALGPRPELPGMICYDLYKTRMASISKNSVFFPMPPRHPRTGLVFEDLSHAHLIITYSQCKCFDPTTQEGWDYLLTCNRLFDDIDILVKRFVRIKEERAVWDEKAKSFKPEL